MNWTIPHVTYQNRGVCCRTTTFGKKITFCFCFCIDPEVFNTCKTQKISLKLCVCPIKGVIKGGMSTDFAYKHSIDLVGVSILVRTNKNYHFVLTSPLSDFVEYRTWRQTLQHDGPEEGRYQGHGATGQQGGHDQGCQVTQGSCRTLRRSPPGLSGSTGFHQGGRHLRCIVTQDSCRTASRPPSGLSGNTSFLQDIKEFTTWVVR